MPVVSVFPNAVMIGFGCTNRFVVTALEELGHVPFTVPSTV